MSDINSSSLQTKSSWFFLAVLAVLAAKSISPESNYLKWKWMASSTYFHEAEIKYKKRKKLSWAYLFLFERWRRTHSAFLMSLFYCRWLGNRILSVRITFFEQEEKKSSHLAQAILTAYSCTRLKGGNWSRDDCKSYFHSSGVHMHN